MNSWAGEVDFFSRKKRLQRQHPTSPFAACLSVSLCVCCIFSARASRRRGCRFSPIIIAQPLLKKCVPESGAHSHTHTHAFSGINLSWVDGEKIYHTPYYMLANQFGRVISLQVVFLRPFLERKNAGEQLLSLAFLKYIIINYCVIPWKRNEGL